MAGLPAWDIADSNDPADGLIADAICSRMSGLLANPK